MEEVKPTFVAIEEAVDGLSFHLKMGRQQARAFMDPLLTAAIGRFDLDIIKLDDWLHTQGYKEETHGSMQDYITLTYGTNASAFISRLIGS